MKGVGGRLKYYSSGNQLAVRNAFPRYARFVRFVQFLSYVVVGSFDECWNWSGGVGDFGYGIFHWPEKKINLAHVAAYVLFVGSIPKRKGKAALKVCHSCDNPSCVNPTHLWLGTDLQNVRDMAEKGRARKAIGEGNAAAKLTEDSVREIRRLYKTSDYTYVALGRKFGVHPTTIGQVVRGANWIQ